jgi:hypothetical protein
MQYGSNLGLQGLQGAQQGLGTALQGGQLGLSGIGTAMQGQQAGMQGLTTANQLYGTGIQGSQAGMQGAGVGLSRCGSSTSGYWPRYAGCSSWSPRCVWRSSWLRLANQAAANWSNIGTQQLAAQTGILGLQNQIGGQQQGQQQQIINQAIQNYAQAQEAPMQSLNQFNALLRGYALPGTTTTQYQAAPTLVNQVAGLGTAGIGALALSNAVGKS